MTEFRPMRRSRQQLSTEECVSILQRGTAGTLALTGDGGYPYAVPLSYVYAGGRLYFHSALRGHKVDAIRHCDKASFAVIAADDVRPAEFTTYFRSVICFGRIHIVETDAEKLEATRLLGRRYNPGDDEGLQQEIKKAYRAMCIIRLDIEHMTGKESIELTRERNTTT